MCPWHYGVNHFLLTIKRIFAVSRPPYRCNPTPVGLKRKVRTPKCGIADNIRPPKGEDQCNRKYVQFGCSEIR